MTNSQKSQDYEQVVEKIVFDEAELEELKTAIRDFSNGKIDIKQLKQLLLQCRGRIVKDISTFLSFCIDRTKNENVNSKNNKPAKFDQNDQNFNQLRKCHDRRC